MDAKIGETQGQLHTRLRGRVDRLEEAVDASLAAHDNLDKSLIRGRVKRLEEAVSEIHEAQAAMEESLRALSLARLTIKRALGDVVSDLTSLSGD